MGSTVVVLVAVLLAVGPEGDASAVLLVGVLAWALAVAVWAVHRSRVERELYESQLLAWAAAQAAQAERLRLARDLHDIVSHGLGLITVRAAAAQRTPAATSCGIPGDQTDGPDAALREAMAALADVESASRSATTELRRMLAVLRSTDAHPAPLHPIEGLEALPDILAEAERHGLRTRLEVEPLGEVSQGVQATVCRVVRETLANTVRHAGPCDVRVRLHRDNDAIVVAVTDSGPDGPRPLAPGSGLGLLGLQETMAAFGGSVRAGPQGPGFRVLTRLPDRAAP